MNWTSGVSSFAAALALTACTLAPPQSPAESRVRIVDTSCDWVKPIYPACADVVSESTARQIVSHNEAGVARCGWKAPAGSSCTKSTGK